MEKKQATESKDKIIIPQNLQKEMIKFFLKTSIPKIAAEKEQGKQQQKTSNSKEWGGNND